MTPSRILTAVCVLAFGALMWLHGYEWGEANAQPPQASKPTPFADRKPGENIWAYYKRKGWAQ